MHHTQAHGPGREAGATTAEYAVGTLGACTVALVLAQLGAGEWFADLVREVFGRALDPRLLFELLGEPRPMIERGP